MSSDIVLASASPRRLELLQQIGVNCHVQAVDIDESGKPGEPATEYVARLARQKALTCVESLPEELARMPVLGADTIVELDGEMLGKPRDTGHARQMLTRLSDNTHYVHTAVALYCYGEMHEKLCTSSVQFGHVGERQIDEYIDSLEPMDKAGAYAIQGGAAAFIRHMQGSYSAVMGLPLFETAELLAECDISIPNNNYKSEIA